MSPQRTAHVARYRSSAPSSRSLALVEAKLAPPPARAEHIARPDLVRLLDELSQRRVTLVAAPTGFGKTTVLAAWARRAGGRAVWVSLDSGDDDPGRFLTYVITALGRAESAIGRKSLRALRAGDPVRSALPRLLDELAGIEEPVTLILDDYHRIDASACHDALGRLLERSPGTLRVVISTQADPPLTLGRWRARGDLGELRVDRLRFTPAEAERLLTGTLGLGLDPESVAVLEERTEGWPAGLYLAALSLRGRGDPDVFVSSFAGSNRHVVDYLGRDVVDAQPPGTRSFLLRTSILTRLSGSLCDDVLEERGSGARLAELARSNLFLIPLDDNGEIYRYHRLFRELLRFLLTQESPELVRDLHRRAATWHEAAGQLDEAVEHALAAGDPDLAAEMLARSWRPLYQFGQHVTLRRLLAGLPPSLIDQSAPLSFIAVLLDTASASEATVERRLQRIETSGWEGPFPDGTPSTEVAVTFVRASFLYGDLGRALDAANRLDELAGDDFIFGAVAAVSRSRALFLQGHLEAALEALPPLGRETAAARPTLAAFAPALRSLILLESGELDEATTLARESIDLAEELGLSELPLLGAAFTALGSVLAVRGDLSEAERQLERGLDLVAKPPDTLVRAYALLALARVRAARGNGTGARVLLVETRKIVEGASDPGALRSRLEDLERRLATRQRRAVSPEDLPTESELRILRLLATGLSQREIATTLYVSLNTVKTHKRGLYRKLGASTRDQALSRAGELGLI